MGGPGSGRGGGGGGNFEIRRTQDELLQHAQRIGYGADPGNTNAGSGSQPQGDATPADTDSYRQGCVDTMAWLEGRGRDPAEVIERTGAGSGGRGRN